MRILLTNDDGIRAPGIRALYHALGGLGEVHVFAPLTVQSATSHGVTFHKPLMVREVKVDDDGDGSYGGIAVDGRPADCVKLAITCLWEQRFGGRPDLVVSGMNAGMNAGIHILYSGTVGAAIEGAFLGVPAIAVSLHFEEYESILWEAAARKARYAIDRILSFGTPPPHSMFNVNIPVTEDGSDGDSGEDAMPPIKVVPMNLAGIRDEYDRRTNPSGQDYFWIRGDGLDFDHTTAGSDVEAIFARAITVTPLHYDLTNREEMAVWRERLVEWGGSAGAE